MMGEENIGEETVSDDRAYIPLILSLTEAGGLTFLKSIDRSSRPGARGHRND